MDYCEGCRYKGTLNGYGGYCTYIFVEGHSRPCPPGKGCTVKVLKERGKKRGKKERISGKAESTGGGK